jgi:hypothetical protein
VLLSRNERETQIQGEDFDGAIVFDECHKSKNLIPSAGGVASKTGAAVVELQARLPHARVLYCSATGVSEPRNMGYMTRLGLWGEGSSVPAGFKDFLASLERRGVGALELLAMEMKRMGLYVCRTLSYEGASFRTTAEQLSPEQRRTYDTSVQFMQTLRRELLEREETGDEAANSGAESDDGEDGWLSDAISGSDTEEATLRGKSRWRYFWGQHQRFFMSLCAAMKVPSVVGVARAALAEGKCVVIGLQSTGEASTKQVMEDADSDELDDFISAPAVVLERLIQKTFPMPPKPRSVMLQVRISG